MASIDLSAPVIFTTPDTKAMIHHHHKFKKDIFKIHHGVYVPIPDGLTKAAEVANYAYSVARTYILTILNHLSPTSYISHSSAWFRGPVNGKVFMSGTYWREVEIAGLQILTVKQPAFPAIGQSAYTLPGGIASIPFRCSAPHQLALELLSANFDDTDRVFTSTDQLNTMAQAVRHMANADTTFLPNAEKYAYANNMQTELSRLIALQSSKNRD